MKRVRQEYYPRSGQFPHMARDKTIFDLTFASTFKSRSCDCLDNNQIYRGSSLVITSIIHRQNAWRLEAASINNILQSVFLVQSLCSEGLQVYRIKSLLI